MSDSSPQPERSSAGAPTRASAPAPAWRATLPLDAAFVLLWNSGFIGAEFGLPYTGPFTLLFWRYLALTVVLAAWLAATRRFVRTSPAAVARTALLGVLAHGVWLGCVLLAIDLDAPVGIIALVTALQPLLTGALARPVTGEPTSPGQWLGLVLGFLGVAVAVGWRLSNDAETPALAYLLPFGSVLGITAASLLKRRWATRGIQAELPMDATLFYQSLAVTLAVLAPAWLAEGFRTDWTPPFIATMTWLVLAVSLGAYWIMWRLLQKRPATHVASLFYLSPPVTMLMAYAAFNDPITPTDLLGLAITATGVYLVHRHTKPNPPTD